MTTRFSEKTDMGILGMVPRPYGDAMYNIQAQVYMYGVTGVRSSREGNIGPALINIEQSQTVPGYMGLDLSDPDGNWVYASPMSWKSDGTAAMWMERERGGNGVRVQIVRLLDYAPDAAVEAVTTPTVGNYARKPEKLGSYDVTVPGASSGSVRITKTSSGLLGLKSTVTVAYDNYSDDGEIFFNGTETSSGAITAKTTYESKLQITNAAGEAQGGMAVTMNMSAAYSVGSLLNGNRSPVLDKKTSGGTASWEGVTVGMEQLVP